ncbi:hypothetical protein [Bittarella massiliensis (ex Durand et al. 2017)]|uniref:hypothetical protein n=1 Tax=Bittarella massiliensis (ex Durand et al. 2017) TaxID=1720313 RepID=UPI001AA15127|nr:hypothetical protein [Bittarella massiliensis (ex Durand et al. 2017)]MBO1680697.1 hypothetical protein [Bittarella massiliensis (ex Durand et al. 2017)]
MDKNRKYDTLTKNALVDEILKQVRAKREPEAPPPASAPTLPRPGGEKRPSAAELVKEVQAERSAASDPLQAAWEHRHAPGGERETAAPPEPAPRGEGAVAPEAAVAHREIHPFSALPHRESEADEAQRIQKVASFFSGEETPESIVPEIEGLPLERERRPKKKRFSWGRPAREEAAPPAPESVAPSAPAGGEGPEPTPVPEGGGAPPAAKVEPAAPAESGEKPAPIPVASTPAEGEGKEEEKEKTAAAPAAPAPAQPERRPASETDVFRAIREPVPLNVSGQAEIFVERSEKRARELPEEAPSGTFDIRERMDREMRQAVAEAESLDTRELLRRARAPKVSQFTIEHGAIGDAEAFTGEEESAYTQAEDEEDFLTDKDEHTALEKLCSLKGKLKMRMGITFTLFLLLCYHNLVPVFGLPVPAFLSPGEGPYLYLGLNLLLLLAGVFCCTSTVVNGFLYTFTLKGDNDSLVGLAFFGCLVQAAVLFVNPGYLKSPDVFLYSSVAMFSLFCNCMGKLNMVHRVLRNYRFIASDSDKYTTEMVEPASLAENIVKDLAIREPALCYRKRSQVLDGFVSHSFSEDPSDRWARVASGICLVLSLAVGCSIYFFKQDLVGAAGAFSLLLCLSAPFSLMFAFNVPFSRTCKTLNRYGGVLAGYSAVERLYDLNGLVVSDTDLFPRGSVLLHGIKTFGGERIDEAILKAASVLCAGESDLKPVFMKVIENRTDILLPYDSFAYENAMGYSCWIENKRVLVGNRELMRNHGIDLPSADYEAKYRKEGERELLYLATSGELTAMFVLSYTANEQVGQLLARLDKTGALIAVKTGDPGLTVSRISETYGLPEDMFTLVHSHTAAQLDALHDDRPGDCGLTTMGSFLSFAQGILCALGAKSGVLAALVVQFVGLGLGVALAALFALTGGAGQLSTAVVLGYQFVWLVLTVALPALKKQ